MMDELIRIENRNGIESVSARELYEFLELDKSHYSRWVIKNIENDEFFTKGVDWVGFAIEANGNQTMDYAITIDMAKELAMLARNAKGKEARQYFIEVEKRARELSKPKQLSGQELLALAVIEAQKVIAEKDQQIEAMKPAVQFMADVTGSRDAIEMSQAAKIIGMGYGRNKLFALLRDEGILRHNNEPMQEYVDRKWFRLVEQKWNDDKGETHISIKTLVYQKGIDGIIKLIRSKA
jgi:anti-repressor protein